MPETAPRSPRFLRAGQSLSRRSRSGSTRQRHLVGHRALRARCPTLRLIHPLPQTAYQNPEKPVVLARPRLDAKRMADDTCADFRKSDVWRWLSRESAREQPRRSPAEHAGFTGVSAQSFEHGHQDEARRLATVFRVLRQGRSESETLLGRPLLTSGLRPWDTAARIGRRTPRLLVAAARKRLRHARRASVAPRVPGRLCRRALGARTCGLVCRLRS
jgi:hypothetical protein